jgi:hypothetical protein
MLCANVFFNKRQTEYFQEHLAKSTQKLCFDVPVSTCKYIQGVTSEFISEKNTFVLAHNYKLASRIFK